MSNPFLYLDENNKVYRYVYLRDIKVGMLAYSSITEKVEECVGIVSNKGGTREVTWATTKDPDHLARIKTALLLLE